MSFLASELITALRLASPEQRAKIREQMIDILGADLPSKSSKLCDPDAVSLESRGRGEDRQLRPALSFPDALNIDSPGHHSGAVLFDILTTPESGRQ